MLRPDAFTYSVAIEQDGLWTHARASNVLGLRATAPAFGVRGDIVTLLDALVKSLAPYRRITAVERHAMESAIGATIRHAERLRGSSDDAADFKWIELSTSGDKLGLNLCGVAAASLRNDPERYLFAYNLHIFIDENGEFINFDGDEMVEGVEALYVLDGMARE